MPNLGPGAMTFNLWLATPGQRLYEGDRVAEVLLGAATVDVLSPADGKMLQTRAQPGDVVRAGETLGWVEE
jgi:biotin carboxyl carrier protein